MRKLKLLVLAAALLCPARPASAEEPPQIPIEGATILSQPGTYVLSDNINLNPFETIQITGNGITLDLRGHRIIGYGSTVALRIESSASDVTVRGGQILAFYAFVSQGTNTVIENMSFGGCDRCAVIDGSGSARVEDSQVAGYVTGLSVGGEHIQHVIVRNNYASALIYPMSVGMREGVVENNVIVSLQRSGLSVGALGRGIVRGNSVFGGSSSDNSPGISIGASDSLIINNSSTVIGGSGMLISGPGNQIEGNVLSGNGQNGLVLYSDQNLIRGNVLTGNRASGLRVNGHGNRIDGNEVENN